MSNRRFIVLCIVVGLILGVCLYALSDRGDSNTPPSTLGGLLPDDLLPTDLLQGKRPWSYNDGISLAAPSVVSIYTSETIYRRTDDIQGPAFSENSIAPEERRKTSQGSGVIFQEDGHILTNHHLIRDADVINVALNDGRLFRARLIGTDPETDLAVIKIDDTAPFPSSTLDSDIELRVGDIVLAIGNPFGVGQTVTQGIVSAISRHVSGASQLQNFVQIDAAINPGNSGGALVNPDGALVGINSAVFSRNNGAQGIGFAIPVSLIREVVEDLLSDGRVIRGWLGVGLGNLQQYPDLYPMAEFGAVITGIFQNGPAHLAGLRRFDIITHVNEEPVRSAEALLKRVSSLSPGEVTNLQGVRLRQDINVNVTLAERPEIQSTNQ